MNRRVGIYRTGSLGDHLIALPLYRQIRELHRHDSLALICNLPAQGNPKLIGPASVLPESLFDEFYSYPVGSDWRAVAQTYRLFRDARLDLLYYMMPVRPLRYLWRDRLFFHLVRIPVIGLRTERASHRPKYFESSKLYEHEADRLARAIPMFDGKLRKTSQDLSLELTVAERTEGRAMMGNKSECTVAVSVGTKLPVNDWGVDKWSKLIKHLAEVPTIDRLVLIGAPDEYAYSEKLRQQWSRESYNFCGQLSPRISAAILADASLFIGHDSGPMHMAAAVDVPIVAIFSSRNLPGIWFPLSQNKRIHYTTIECMGCGRLKCEDRKMECIRRISVEDVFASCVAALAGDVSTTRERARLYSSGPVEPAGRNTLAQ